MRSAPRGPIPDQQPVARGETFAQALQADDALSATAQHDRRLIQFQQQHGFTLLGYVNVYATVHPHRNVHGTREAAERLASPDVLATVPVFAPTKSLPRSAD